MKTCLHCRNNFTPKHGNQQYCSTICNKTQKAKTQQKLYGLLKEFRKGYLTNYRIFNELLEKPGSKTFSLDLLRSRGFRSDSYYGASINDRKETYYRVGEYHFHIFIADKTTSIKILKN